MRHVVFSVLGFSFALGCTGPEGQMGSPGEPGAVGTVGPSGTSCWDLNMNRMCDADEDVDQSGACDAADCLGAPGPVGPVGPRGPMGLTGATGSFVTSGCTYVTGPQVSGVNGTTITTVTCPAGQLPFGSFPVTFGWFSGSVCIPLALFGGTNFVRTRWEGNCSGNALATTTICCS
jgi:hypothetical protein